MTITRALALATLSAGIAACGGASTSPKPAQVDGNWLASFSKISGNVAGIQISCSSVEPTQLSISQSGLTFNGTYDGGTLSCSAQGETAEGDFGSGSVINGTISGRNVAFDLDVPVQHLTGVVDGASASGRITITDEADGITLSGTWSATRSSAASALIARSVSHRADLIGAARIVVQRVAALYDATR